MITIEKSENTRTWKNTARGTQIHLNLSHFMTAAYVLEPISKMKEKYDHQTAVNSF